jgi:hypothetical protein
MAELPQSARPDRCGLLIHIARNTLGGHGVNVVECRSGAIDARANRALIQQCLEIPCRLVTLRRRNGRTRLYSRDPTWIADMLQRTPELQNIVPADIKVFDAEAEES